MKVILYSSDICPKCNVLKTKLNDAAIEFENITGEKAIEAGIDEVPILEVDGERMDFSESIKWLNKVKE